MYTISNLLIPYVSNIVNKIQSTYHTLNFTQFCLTWFKGHFVVMDGAINPGPEMNVDSMVNAGTVSGVEL